MPDEEPGRTYIPVDKLGWRHSRLSFVRVFLACTAFTLGLYAFSSNFALVLLLVCLGLLIAVNGADSFWPSFFGLQLVGTLGLWKLGYIVMQFRQGALESIDWVGVLVALLALALAVELALGFAVSFVCSSRDSLFLREDVGFASFLRGMFGAPSGFAIVTGYKLVPTFLFAISLMMALWLGETIFSLLIWKSNERVIELIFTATCLAIAVFFLRMIAKRTSPGSASEILQRDARPPVVFLRSFSDDRVGLNPRSLFLFDRILNLAINPTDLDRMLVLEFSTYGPVIAVGDPKSPVKTFGVYRDFLNDEQSWQSYVHTNVIKAAAIVVVPDFAKDGLDLSDGVKWELTLIRRLGLLDKTLVVVPSKYSKSDQNARLWSQIAKVLGVDLPMKPDTSYLGVYFEEVDQCFLLSKRFRADSYRLSLRHFFRYKRYRTFAY